MKTFFSLLILASFFATAACASHVTDDCSGLPAAKTLTVTTDVACGVQAGTADCAKLCGSGYSSCRVVDLPDGGVPDGGAMCQSLAPTHVQCGNWCYP